MKHLCINSIIGDLPLEFPGFRLLKPLLLATLFFRILPVAGIQMQPVQLKNELGAGDKSISVMAAPAWGGACRIGRYLGVRLELQAAADAPARLVSVGLAPETGSGAWAERIRINPGVIRTVYLCVLYNGKPLEVRIEAEDGETLFRASILNVLTALSSEQRLVVVVTESPGDSAEPSGLTAALAVPVSPSLLPTDSRAYDPVDLLVFPSLPPPAVSEARAAAFREYLSGGGIIALGVTGEREAAEWLFGFLRLERAPGRTAFTAADFKELIRRFPALDSKGELDDTLRIAYGCGESYLFPTSGKSVATSNEEGKLFSPRLAGLLRKRLRRPIEETPPDVDRAAYHAFDACYRKVPGYRLVPLKILSVAAMGLMLLLFLLSPGKKRFSAAWMTSMAAAGGITAAAAVAVFVPGGKTYVSQLTIRFSSSTGQGDLIESYTLFHRREPKTVQIESEKEARIIPVSEKSAEAAALDARGVNIPGAAALDRFLVTPRPYQPLVRTVLPDVQSASEQKESVSLGENVFTWGSKSYRLRVSPRIAETFHHAGFAVIEFPYPSQNLPAWLEGKQLNGSLETERLQADALRKKISGKGMDEAMWKYLRTRARIRISSPRIFTWLNTAEAPLTMDGKSLTVADGWTVVVSGVECDEVRPPVENGGGKQSVKQH